MIKRPQPDEYSALPARYVDLVVNGPILEILEYQQQSTYNFFVRMDPGKAAYAYADGKWTVKQVLGHMADSERVFAYRALAFSREAIESMTEDQTTQKGIASGNPVSVRALAYIIAGHEMHHIKILKERYL